MYLFLENPQKLLQYCEADLVQAQVILNQILSAPKHSVESTLAPLNEIERILSNASSVANLFFNVHPETKVRDLAQVCLQKLSRFSTELTLNRPLFLAIQNVNTDKLDTNALRFYEKTIEDFQRNGVNEDEKNREKIKKLNEELVEIGQEFEKNIREDVRWITLNSIQELDGLPQDYIESHPLPARITTDYPDFVPFMMYAKNSKAREKLAFESKNRGNPKNIEILKALLSKRHELANILGYLDWATYITENKMIKNPKKVFEFIEKIAEISSPVAKREYQALLDFKSKEGLPAASIEGFEASYYEEKLKLEKFSFDSKDVRSYFEFSRVKEGLLNLTAEIFSLKYIKVSDVPVWHESVEVYEVFCENALLGKIYLDLHPRENKFKHAAQFILRPGVAGTQVPEGVLVCNFPDPHKILSHSHHWNSPQAPLENASQAPLGTASQAPLENASQAPLGTASQAPLGNASQAPLENASQAPLENAPDFPQGALLEHKDVTTFFHEFGHLLHHVLGGNQKWVRFSGVATEWDFVEAPSQLFEEWAWDLKILRRFARHVKTNECIPDDLVQKMRRSDEFGKGLRARQQMFYAACSFQFHVQDPKNFDPLKLAIELQEKYSPYPYQTGTFFPLSFGHLESYSALYYTYMWSLVIAKELFSVFKEKGLLSPECALHYRQTILEPGGSQDAENLIHNFLGRPYSFDAFGAWLGASDV